MKSGKRGYSWLLLVCLLSLVAVASRPSRFGDIYDCYVIVDAECSERGGDYEQVDYEDLLSIVQRARLSYVGFEPRWVVNLYDDYGIRYMLYVSRSASYLRIDGNLFRLNNRQSRRLRRLLGG